MATMALDSLGPNLAWWRQAHVGLAADLVRLQHVRQAVSRKGPGTERIRRSLARIERVRDALYALYWAVSDSRMLPPPSAGGPFEMHVRRCYAWCAMIVQCLRLVVNELRDGRHTDWHAVRLEVGRHAEAWVSWAATVQSSVAETARLRREGG